VSMVGDRPPKFFTLNRRTKISTTLIVAVNSWLLFFIGCAPKQKVWVKSGESIASLGRLALPSIIP
jgi:hypothetical protein